MWWGPNAIAQATRAPEVASCRECSLRVISKTEIVLPADATREFNWPGTVVADGGQRVYMAFTGHPAIVTVDFNTRAVSRTSIGQQATEIFALAHIAADTLVAGGRDASGPFVARVTVPSGVLSRAPLELIPRIMAVASDGTMLLNGDVFTPERAGFVLHAMATTRAEVRSFKLAQPDSSNVYWLAPRRAAGFWAVPAMTYGATRYAIEAWTAEGKRLQSISADAPWLYYAYSEDGRPIGPPPAILGIHEDPEGTLWVLGRVKKAGWEAGAAKEGNTLEIPLRKRQYDLLYDSMVELYDSRTGRLILRQLLPGHAVALGSARRLVSLRRTDDDRLVVTLSQLRLVRR